MKIYLCMRVGQYNIILETYQSFKPPSSTPGEIDMYATDFFVQNLMLKYFYLKLFLI